MEDLKEKLWEIVTLLYQNTGVSVQPLYPKILVRVLPREQESKGGIILPEGARQNKPLLEGVVLNTFEPFYKTEYYEDEEYKIKIEPSVKVGDHVLFPHIAEGITPVWPLDDGVGEYRMVPDDLIAIVLHYDGQVSTKEWLNNLMDDFGDSPENEALVDTILEKANVVRKDYVARTMSGR